MNTFINMITTGGLYVIFGIWSFVNVLEYKYFTRVEQYDTIIKNMKQCNQKYGKLLVKVSHLENRVSELEDILLLKDEIEELNLASNNESKQMNAEDSNILETVETHNETVETHDETVETHDETVETHDETVKTHDETATDLVTSTDNPVMDEEIVDISEETYPVKNPSQNKKGWIKTLLFM